MKTAQDELFRMDRNELKKIVRETEERARKNGWTKSHPYSEMKRDGRLGAGEFARYQMADAILRNTVDLDEGAVSGLGGSVALLRALDDARKASNACAPNMESAFGSRFDRIVNSLALLLLVNVERKCVVLDMKKFRATIETNAAKSVEIEAADREEAEAKAERLAGKGEFVSYVEEVTE